MGYIYNLYHKLRDKRQGEKMYLNKINLPKYDQLT